MSASLQDCPSTRASGVPGPPPGQASPCWPGSSPRPARFFWSLQPTLLWPLGSPQTHTSSPGSAAPQNTVFRPCPATRPSQRPKSQGSGSWRCRGRRGGELAELQAFPELLGRAQPAHRPPPTERRKIWPTSQTEAKVKRQFLPGVPQGAWHWTPELGAAKLRGLHPYPEHLLAAWLTPSCPRRGCGRAGRLLVTQALPCTVASGESCIGLEPDSGLLWPRTRLRGFLEGAGVRQARGPKGQGG